MWIDLTARTGKDRLDAIGSGNRSIVAVVMAIYTTSAAAAKAAANRGRKRILIQFL
jgi:hypothetical protein